jgi:hypothetical protein
LRDRRGEVAGRVELVHEGEAAPVDLSVCGRAISVKGAASGALKRSSGDSEVGRDAIF